LSSYGVHPARYTGHDCTGCGICFYCCPEPGAITVYRLRPLPKVVITERHPENQAEAGGEHAPAL
jgi:Fe-S-cluster-containing hydrogenase component 2